MSTGDCCFRNVAHSSRPWLSWGFTSLPKLVVVRQRSGTQRDPPGGHSHRRPHFGVIARAAFQPLFTGGTPHGHSVHGSTPRTGPPCPAGRQGWEQATERPLAPSWRVSVPLSPGLSLAPREAGATSRGRPEPGLH